MMKLNNKATLLLLGFLAVLFSSPRLFGQQREVLLQGAYSFRDIGGYKTTTGKSIKWGKIYRSATLAYLSPEDQQILEQLRINIVADFRGPYEIKHAPDLLPKKIHYLPLGAGSETDGPDDWKDMAEVMKTKTMVQRDSEATAYYKDISSFGNRYKPLFDALLDLPKDSAIVFHCVGGKDRTGIAAALIEYALGVDRRQIIQDYVLTNKYRARYNAEIAQLLHLKYGVPKEIAATYGLAKSEFIEATFAEIDRQYGCVDKFLQKEMGLDPVKIKQLQTLYLQ